MALAVLGMRFLEVLFFAGIAGSSIVVVISFIEDIQELFGSDEALPAVGEEARPPR